MKWKSFNSVSRRCVQCIVCALGEDHQCVVAGGLQCTPDNESLNPTSGNNPGFMMVYS